MATQTKFLDSKQLAEELGNRVNTIEGWRVKGIGPKYLKLNGLVRYRREDIDVWIEAQVRSSTSQVAA